MIEKEELINYQKKAEKYIENNFDIVDFEFNHFGIKASSNEEYQNIKKELTKGGSLYNEVFWNTKNISTIVSENVKYEVSEPNENELIDKIKIDHIAYKTSKFDYYLKKLKEKIIAQFDVGATKGFKIKTGNKLIIEIRNNDILESVKDFSKNS